ncbi:MAG: extracellular solute-binding protein, partial [Actinomycetota bacterium]|nr:extracellular solute-binding protein [Actinomycetota bacterium]
AEWDAALAVLQDAVDSGQIRGFTGNEYAEGLAKGDIAACIAWSGDVIQLIFGKDNVELILPEAGSMLWSDNMLIPVGAEHKKNAELWMDWYMQPEIAAELAAWVNYICPVEGGQEAMAKIDKSLVNNSLIFPTADDLANTAIFRGLSEDEDTRYTEQFQALYT